MPDASVDPQPAQPNELTAAVQKIAATVDKLTDRMSAMEREKTTPTNDGADEAQPIGIEIEPKNQQLSNADIPSVSELRRNTALNREVQRRLAELDFTDDFAEPQLGATNQRPRGKRSGAARTVQDTIINDIDWPHFHIYSPPGTEPMTFSQLSIAEFVYGYLLMVDQQGAKFDREIMWSLLRNIMEDATEYPWALLKNFFWILGSNVENDRMKWSDTQAIEHLRYKYAQKYELPAKKAQTSATEKLKYCGPYQSGSCAEKGDHAGLRHICGYCYRTKSSPYPHPERDCRRKTSNEAPKNEKGGK